MKRIQTRLGSLCMAVVMLLSLAVTPAIESPHAVQACWQPY